MPYIYRRFPIGPPLVKEILVREDGKEEERENKELDEEEEEIERKESRIYT